MSDYESNIAVLKQINNIAVDFIRNLEIRLEENYETWSDAIDQEVRNFKETGVLSTNLRSLIRPAVVEELSDKDVINSVSNSSKENDSVSRKKSQLPARITRQALREPSQLINQQHDLSKDSNAQVIVKVERLTQNQLSKCSQNSALQVKKEQFEMPPPSKPLRQPRQTRKQKEQDSLKIKTELIEANVLARDSDVIVEVNNITTIVLDNEEEEVETSVKSTRARTKNPSKTVKEVTDVPVTRSTRTKTRAAAMNKIEDIELAASEQLKRLRDSSSESELKDSNLTKSKAKIRKIESGSDKNITTAKEISTINNVNGPNEEAVNQNQTYVCDNNDKGGAPQVLNCTVVLEKPLNNLPKNVQDIMTDDEDVPAPLSQNKQKLKPKPVFSPYEDSPVKKKVEAFEKLGAASASHMPIRSMRQKGKTNQSEQMTSINKFECSSLKSRGIPKAIPGSAEKQSSKTLTPSLTNSSLKPRSALKSSQAAFRERELLRQQKENDARLKKEAALQAAADEKRRKLDEKQLKAQQQRVALFKEKQKALEQSERAKQEKLKKFSADKEEKLIKKKEQNAQKLANAVRKAAEEKGKDKVLTPKYMKTKTPLLPIDDCYDSDQGNSKPITIPLWQRKGSIRHTAILKKITKQQNKELFLSLSQTVDLQEIFPTIEPKKLKRTSSAIWNRSAMIRLESMHEEEEDSDSH